MTEQRVDLKELELEDDQLDEVFGGVAMERAACAETATMM